mgnify:CR=1 FL=1
MEESIAMHDPLIKIINETFTKVDSYLKENQRCGLAALIVFGGWIETLYLATNIVDLKNPQKESDWNRLTIFPQPVFYPDGLYMTVQISRHRSV